MCHNSANRKMGRPLGVLLVPRSPTGHAPRASRLPFCPPGLVPHRKPMLASSAVNQTEGKPPEQERHRRIGSNHFSSQQFQALFHSLFKVLSIFPSQYLFAIGLSPIFSFRWSLPPTLACIPKQADSLERSYHAHPTESKTGL